MTRGHNFVLFRIASALLIMMTLGFFMIHSWDDKKPKIIKEISPWTDNNTKIIRDQYLLLMEEGQEKYLDLILTEFDLYLMAPVEEWLVVASKQALARDVIIELNSPEGIKALAMAKRLANHALIHSAKTNFMALGDISCQHHGLAKHHNHDQWHIGSKGINLAKAWEITTGNNNNVIGIVDRNFNSSCDKPSYYIENFFNHLAQPLKLNTADDDNHGANIMAVLSPCQKDFVSIDDKAKILAIDSKSDASLSTRMLGLLWASGINTCTSAIVPCSDWRLPKNHHPADIINASFGFAGEFLADPPYGMVLDVIGKINRQGKIIVASAGNEGIMCDRRLPGSAGGVISVGSFNQKRQSSYFSNYGKTVDILAPGEDIHIPHNEAMISVNGTSFAAPIVSGVVSLMLAANPLLSWKSTEFILKKTADPLSCDDYCPDDMTNKDDCRQYCCKENKVICASGMINAYQAVLMAKAGIPQEALVDVDDYYLPLSKYNNMTSKLIIKNWGKKRGMARLRPSDPYLVMTPETVMLDGIDAYGIPLEKMVMLSYKHKPKTNKIIYVIIEIANEDNIEVFHDDIEAIVEIIPDY